MSLTIFLVYLTVSFVYIISPGPAVFLAINNGVRGGLLPLIVSSFANIAGLFLLSLVSILGLGAIVLASTSLFLTVKVIGATYLLYLGYKQLKQSHELSTYKANNPMKTFSDEDKSLSAYFLESFILAATNPKPVLFFVAIFPQFLDPNAAMTAQFFVLTFSFMLISFFSLFTYGYIGNQAKHLLTKQQVLKWFHRVTGGLFITMGLGLMKLKSTQ